MNATVTTAAEPDAVPGVVPAATRPKLAMMKLSVVNRHERRAPDTEAALSCMNQLAQRRAIDPLLFKPLRLVAFPSDERTGSAYASLVADMEAVVAKSPSIDRSLIVRERIDQLHVRDVHAATNSTKMVDGQTGRDWSVDPLPRIAVGVAVLAVELELHVAVSVVGANMQEARPEIRAGVRHLSGSNTASKSEFNVTNALVHPERLERCPFHGWHSPSGRAVNVPQETHRPPSRAWT
jgi:hypothetical protein